MLPVTVCLVLIRNLFDFLRLGGLLTLDKRFFFMMLLIKFSLNLQPVVGASMSAILKDHIKHDNYACSGKYTLNYRLGGNDG